MSWDYWREFGGECESREMSRRKDAASELKGGVVGV